MSGEQGSLNRLSGRVALVTGVARPRGMGACTARLFAQEGARVAVVDMADEVSQRAEEISRTGGEAEAYRVDLSDLEETKSTVGRVLDRFEKIDILVNVAGKSVPPRPAFLDMTEDYWNMVMDRNLRTTLNCGWAVLPHMVERRYGKVINFSSPTGVKTVYRYSAAYAASKGAVSALTRALALEMGAHNIMVNAILPGDIDTGDEPWRPEDGRRDLGVYSPHLDSPVPRPGRSEEVAQLALYLATDESSFITGSEIVIDGGLTIVEPMASGPQ